MNEEAALVAACLASPKENTPRLMYADWLDEYGTTERQKAQSEWIRLTCKKPRVGSMRQPGERDWLLVNFHRLFPVLWEELALPKPRGVKLVMNCITAVVQVPTKSRGLDSPYATSQVDLIGARGIINTVQVTFTRASVVAPWAAADCPLAKIKTTIPYGVLWERNQSGVTVSSRCFETRELVEVFEGLEGYTQSDSMLDNRGSRSRVYSRDMFTDPKQVAREAINSSLTRWARKKAGIPHVVLPELTPEDDDSDRSEFWFCDKS